jgi:arabinan endo-1,5-alpha-L-arabinosidase
MKSSQIQIRDPFVLPLQSAKKYYLFGTTDKNCWNGEATGFDVYIGKDLQEWEGPFAAFRPAKDFWANENFWAPEVYAYNNKYYMFASFKREGICRGTQILVSDTPEGPYLPNSDGPVTPRDWECLDGTLYVEPQGDPWMVFCHEWVQAYDGEMCAIRLNKELTSAIGKPHLLFKASEAPWCRLVKSKSGEKEGYVTDGPNFYRTKDSQLLMIWSSHGEDGYAMGVATSGSGNVLGPWKQAQEPIYRKDGGHGMIFRTFEGKTILTIHTPNDTPNERPVFLELFENDGKLELAEIE